MPKYDSFGWSVERKEFASDWYQSIDHFWHQTLGHLSTASELQREDMIGFYHTNIKPRLLLDTVKREVVRGTSLGKIKYLAISHGWPPNGTIGGVKLDGMYWKQDCINERALDCLIKDAWLLGFRYVWVDALCTPQKKDFDIEDINRMGSYYSECATCLVYLDKIGVDVSTNDVATGNLPWFSRYWTLQEAWLPYQCLFKLSHNNGTVFATDYNFFWLIAASPRLGEIQTLQRGFELLGSGWWPTLSNIDRQLASRTGFDDITAIYSILHLVRPLFKDRDVQAPRETDVAKLAKWFVDQLRDPSQLVNCPTILSLFGESNEYAWLRGAPQLPMSMTEAECIEYNVIWPSDPTEQLVLCRSREYHGLYTGMWNVRQLWDHRVARSTMRTMVRRTGGGNRLCEGLLPKLKKFLDVGGPSGHTMEAVLGGYEPKILALVSTFKRWVGDPMVVVRELVLVKGNADSDVHHCVGWRESILYATPFYKRQTIRVAAPGEGYVPIR
ncbi:hypothetical protein BJ742DRAFT_510852 [Cladochytrium replicatum]|nr:hypothetical protein BJ742DRAFT_510852 [Cladochytrium replicatum]